MVAAVMIVLSCKMPRIGLMVVTALIGLFSRPGFSLILDLKKIR